MKELMKKNRGKFILATVFYGVCAIIETYFAIVLGNIIDDASNADLQKMLEEFGIAVALLLCSILFVRVALGFRTSYTVKVIEQVKQRLMNSIYSRGLLSFRKQNETYYMNLLSTDIDMVQEDYLMQRSHLGYYVIQFVTAIIALVFISWKALLFFVILFLLPMIVPGVFGQILAKRKQAESKENENYLFTVKEQIMGMTDITMSLSVSSYIHKYLDANHLQQSAKRKSSVLSRFTIELSSALSLVAQMGCMAAGGYLVIQGEMSIGQLIAAVQLLNSVFNPINAISQVQTMMNGTRSIRDKIDREIAIPVADTETKQPGMSHDITGEALSAWYDDGKPIFNSLSFHFSSHRIFAIVGESGCGKTTIMKCILKQHDLYSGAIRLGGADIREMSQNTIYEKVGYVPQNLFLFNDTLEQNIMMGRDYSQSELISVIEKTKLTKLYETQKDKLGDSGNKLSGGEKQRIAIARVLIRHPEIIIFDEPTASLDPATRDTINELIFDLTDYTRIVITHDQRPQYIDRFDECISLPSDRAAVMHV